jgi:hypothetical protein
MSFNDLAKKEAAAKKASQDKASKQLSETGERTNTGPKPDESSPG